MAVLQLFTLIFTLVCSIQSKQSGGGGAPVNPWGSSLLMSGSSLTTTDTDADPWGEGEPPVNPNSGFGALNQLEFDGPQTASQSPAAQSPIPTVANAPVVATVDRPAATVAPPVVQFKTATPAPATAASPSPAAAAASPAPGPMTTAQLITPVRGQCHKTCVRKEASSLSPDEWSRLAKAMLELNRGHNGASMTPYEQLVQDHIDHSPLTHGTDLFFSYHRYFLIRFERSLQGIDPEVCVPYWDWSRTSQEYRSHPMFTPNLMGAPNPGCFASTLFPNWNTRQSGGACVSRQMSSSTLAAMQFVVGIMQGSPRYADFRPRYESQCHGSPHVAIGGTMSTMASPSDPIFWLHHGMNDKHFLDYNESFNGSSFPNPKARIPGSSLTAGELENPLDWCYTYDNSKLKAEAEVKPPSELPDDWLKMSFGDNATVINDIRNQTNSLLNSTEDMIARNETKELVIPDRDITKAISAPSSANSSKSLIIPVLPTLVAAIISIFMGL